MANRKEIRRPEECPNCGSKEFVEGVQEGYAAVSRSPWAISRGTIIRHVCCRDCGLVLFSYVEKPERLLPPSERRN